MDYKSKYLKYKAKYLNLLQQKGGNVTETKVLCEDAELTANNQTVDNLTCYGFRENNGLFEKMGTVQVAKASDVTLKGIALCEDYGQYKTELGFDLYRDYNDIKNKTLELKGFYTDGKFIETVNGNRKRTAAVAQGITSCMLKAILEKYKNNNEFMIMHAAAAGSFSERPVVTPSLVNFYTTLGFKYLGRCTYDGGPLSEINYDYIKGDIDTEIAGKTVDTSEYYGKSDDEIRSSYINDVSVDKDNNQPLLIGKISDVLAKLNEKCPNDKIYSNIIILDSISDKSFNPQQVIQPKF